jgi:hypothetical protein
MNKAVLAAEVLVVAAIAAVLASVPGKPQPAADSPAQVEVGPPPDQSLGTPCPCNGGCECKGCLCKGGECKVPAAVIAIPAVATPAPPARPTVRTEAAFTQPAQRYVRVRQLQRGPLGRVRGYRDVLVPVDAQGRWMAAPPVHPGNCAGGQCR